MHYYPDTFGNNEYTYHTYKEDYEYNNLEYDSMHRYMPQEEWHTPYNISLGELIRDSVIIWGEENTLWDYYNIKQYWRVSQKIEMRYKWRNISIIPVSKWLDYFVNHMNLIMPKYKLAYAALDKRNDITITNDDYLKTRRINSEFPATQLKPNEEDYASNADDYEQEGVRERGFLDSIDQLKNYDDIDKVIVDSCEKLFSSLYTVNIDTIN